jgi:hypothetical protein
MRWRSPTSRRWVSVYTRVLLSFAWWRHTQAIETACRK